MCPYLKGKIRIKCLDNIMLFFLRVTGSQKSGSSIDYNQKIAFHFSSQKRYIIQPLVHDLQNGKNRKKAKFLPQYGDCASCHWCSHALIGRFREFMWYHWQLDFSRNILLRINSANTLKKLKGTYIKLKDDEVSFKSWEIEVSRLHHSNFKAIKSYFEKIEKARAWNSR